MNHGRRDQQRKTGIRMATMQDVFRMVRGRGRGGTSHLGVAAMIGLLVCLPGCPVSDSQILTFSSWYLRLTQDAAGGVPAYDIEGGLWDWGFSEDTLICDGFPGQRLASSIPYQAIDGEFVAEGRLSVSYFYEHRNEFSQFDTLRPGDTFGTAEITLALTGYSSVYGTWTLAGSYVITFDEEWGGETFSGTFEGRRYVVTKDER